ncbi:alpha/beta hydrolase [Radicibacter daui]|uniref:alpha/beta hydrolase n=1 Tax=Radicibacter daui TaxID=3064829 RepID=UPI004046BA53
MVAPLLKPALATAFPRESFPLWDGAPPGGGGPAGPAHMSAGGALSNVVTPSLEVFRPEKPNGTAMLIAAGGGYRRIEQHWEAYPAARWLAARGITAFVLTYRLPGEGWKAGPLAPLQDAQRALRLIKAREAEFGIDADEVGVLGFSAGGHLMGLAASWSAFESYRPRDEADALSARPALAALIYPVITLEAPYNRTSTCHVMLGEHPELAQSAEWSIETHVAKDCPPMFLVQALDDGVVNPANATIMADACQRAGVPLELHRLASGGHGFGMGHAGSPSAEWPGWYEAWLRSQLKLA